MKFKTRKPKKNSSSVLKKKAWSMFSKYIRLRDCLLTTGTKERGVCFTCGRTYTFEQLQAGHFVGGRLNSILFLEDNVHAQCVKCNMFLHGNIMEYLPRMIELYGQKRVDELKSLRNKEKKWAIGELESIYLEYKTLYEEAYANN